MCRWMACRGRPRPPFFVGVIGSEHVKKVENGGLVGTLGLESETVSC